MVRRFLDWHAANPRELIAVEQALKVRIGQVEITGRVDRLEADEEGRAVVVDLKTGGSAPREDELGRHPQLGVYQLAVLLGAFERFGLAEPGGAELVQVGKAAGVTLRAKVQRQGALAEDPEPGWAKDLVETVAARHGRACLRGQGEPRLPHLPGRLLLPGPPGRRAGHPVTADPVTAGPVTADPVTAGPVTADPVTAGPGTAGPSGGSAASASRASSAIGGGTSSMASTCVRALAYAVS